MVENTSSIRRRRLPPLPSLRAFEAAARHLSFGQAAEELAVTPSAISHHIRQLEETLGLSLFVRRVRSVALTPAGARLYPVLRDGLDSFESVLADLRAPVPRRFVTLSATTLVTARLLIPALSQFKSTWPQYELRLHASDEPVDLAAEQADIAIRYGRGPFDGLASQSLRKESFGVVCSPSLVLSSPKQLPQMTLIHSEWLRRDEQPDWDRWRALADLPDLDISSGLHFSDESHALQAAIAGHGVAITSLLLCEDELKRGVLVHPFGPVIEGEQYHVLTSPQNMKSADVQAVWNWLVSVVFPSGPAARATP